MNLRVVKCDMVDSSPQVILHPDDAESMGLKIGDRVTVKGSAGIWTTLYGTSPTYANRGEACMPEAFLERHGYQEGETVDIEHSPRPESVGFIRKKMPQSPLVDVPMGIVLIS